MGRHNFTNSAEPRIDKPTVQTDVKGTREEKSPDDFLFEGQFETSRDQQNSGQNVQQNTKPQ